VPETLADVVVLVVCFQLASIVEVDVEFQVMFAGKRACMPLDVHIELIALCQAVSAPDSDSPLLEYILIDQGNDVNSTPEAVCR